MYAYIRSYSNGAMFDEAWEKQFVKYCPECTYPYPQQTYNRIMYRDGEFDKSVVFGFLDGDLIYIRNDFLNLLPELKTYSLSCDLCNAKTGKIESEWTILSQDTRVIIRGDEYSSCRICPSCKRIIYSSNNKYYVMAHEMNNIPVALAESGILLRKDIYQRLRNTPEWGRMKRKLSVENLRVLEIPEDFLPVVLESLPEEFYLDRKSVSAIADLQLKYEAFCSLFYPSFHDGYPKYEVYEEAYRQPELIVGDDYEAQNIVRMALSRRMFQIERKKEQLSLNENCVTNKLTLKNNVALKNQKVSTLDTQTPKILLTLEELEELFKKYHLQKRWFAFKVFLRSGISLDIQSEEKRFPLGCSRIGGLPDLPSDVEWPCGTDGSLAFLGPFNMNELKPLDIERRLPSRGMLYFFYHAEQKAWGVSIQDFGNWSVLYSKTTRGLKRATLPKDLNAQYHQFPDCKVSFAFLRQIPSPDHPFLKDFFEKEDESESYSELYEEYKNILPSSSYLLGYPVPIQNDMEESCESIYCDHLAAGIDRTDQKTINTLKYAVLWRNLLQLSSEGEANMNWGDCGQLNFMIREDELKEKHFANVWMELQCY